MTFDLTALDVNKECVTVFDVNTFGVNNQPLQIFDANTFGVSSQPLKWENFFSFVKQEDRAATTIIARKLQREKKERKLKRDKKKEIQKT